MKFAIVSVLFLASVGFSCTTFMLGGSEPLVGKSYDWTHGNGIAYVNKRNVLKSSLLLNPFDRKVEWTSKYGSLTFNQYGLEFPNSGLNEKGLVIEIMWLDETEDEPNDGRPILNELQWIQYQLDNYASVAELVKRAPEVRIKTVSGKVHYLACDVSGQCATVEIIAGKLVIHDRLALSLLTNDTYDKSIEALKNYVGFGGTLSIPSGPDSIERFVRAASEMKTAKANLEDAFSILRSVAQTVENPTQWDIVYAMSTDTVTFRTAKEPDFRKVSLKGFDFACSKPVQGYNLDDKSTGDVSGAFHEFSFQENHDNIQQSLSDVQLGRLILPLLANYPKSTRCQD